MLMVQRVFLSKSPPRLITSKAGKNATPAMADADKSFDSNWFNGGGVKWILKLPMPTSALSFPYALDYIPYVWGFVGHMWNGDNREFDSTFFDSADKPPANNCVVTRPVIQSENIITTVSKTGVGAPTSGGFYDGVDFWLVFEG